MANIEETCLVSVPSVTAFEFFLRPQNVVDISDPAVGARIIESPDVLAHDDELTVEVIAFGVVRRVVYRASVDHESLVIVETMIDGDLRAWEHQKSFVLEGDQTRVIDSIEFEPPGGVAGFLLTADKIGAQVSDGIAYRNERLDAALKEFAATL